MTTEAHRRGEYGPCEVPGCGAEGLKHGPYTLWHKVLCCQDDFDLVQRSLDLTPGHGNGEVLEVPAEGGPIHWAAFWAKDRTQPEWLIEPIIPRGKSIAIYAKGGLGKSELSLALAAAAATGQRILNRPPGEPLRTMYLDLEQTDDDLYDRLEELGYGEASNLDPLIYYMLPDLPPLDTAEGGDELIGLAAEHEAELVIIDTTARMLQGAENDADTIRSYYRHTGRPLKAAGFTSMRLDHAGKDAERGMRGTSAKIDDVDVVWRLTHRQDGTRLVADKRRASWVPPRIDLVRYTDPLRYELALQTWPEGTAEVAWVLDALEAPLDASRRTAAKMLREAGEPARALVIGAALKWRREPGYRPGTTPGTTLPGKGGNHPTEPYGGTVET